MNNLELEIDKFYSSKNWKNVKRFYFTFGRRNGKSILSLIIHLKFMRKYCIKKRKYITAFRINRILKQIKNISKGVC